MDVNGDYMKISHELPISLLCFSDMWNSYEYCLCHLLDLEPSYLEHYMQASEKGRHVLLDNSIFELGEAYEPQRYMYWIKTLKPTEYILPDVLEDCNKTISNAISFIDAFEKYIDSFDDIDVQKIHNIKRIGVIQGKTYEECVECYKQLLPLVDKIAISFDYCFFNDYHINVTQSRMLGRVHMINKMLRDNIIDINIPHHLLGCSNPLEFAFYQHCNWIETIDTSSPIVHGIQGVDYGKTALFLNNKQSIKLADLIDWKPSTPGQIIQIQENVEKFKKIVRGY